LLTENVQNSYAVEVETGAWQRGNVKNLIVDNKNSHCLASRVGPIRCHFINHNRRLFAHKVHKNTQLVSRKVLSRKWSVSAR